MTEVKSGYVHKCGKAVKSWKRRWFVLRPNGYLYYYESKDSKVEKGKIDVVDASKIGEWKEVAGVERKLPSGFSYDNTFGIIIRERTFTCVCESDGDSLSWLAAIKKVRDAGGNASYPEPSFSKKEEVPQVQVKKEEVPQVQVEKEEVPQVQVKKEVPLMDQPPPYNPDNYGCSLPRHSSVHVPTTDPIWRSNTLPHQRSSSPAQAAAARLPALPPTNPYYAPQMTGQSQIPVAQPLVSNSPQYPPTNPQYPPTNPQYQASQPANLQYRSPVQPQYRPPSQVQFHPPPQSQYRPPAQPQYRPSAQPQYRPPAQPQYRPPAQPQYRPPAQPQYRPLVQPQYRPPVQPQYRYGPPTPQPQYQPPPQLRPQVLQYQPPPPRQANQLRLQNSTTVTVVTVRR